MDTCHHPEATVNLRVTLAAGHSVGLDTCIEMRASLDQDTIFHGPQITVLTCSALPQPGRPRTLSPFPGVAWLQSHRTQPFRLAPPCFSVACQPILSSTVWIDHSYLSISYSRTPGCFQVSAVLNKASVNVACRTACPNLSS